MLRGGPIKFGDVDYRASGICGMEMYMITYESKVSVNFKL